MNKIRLSFTVFIFAAGSLLGCTSEPQETQPVFLDSTETTVEKTQPIEDEILPTSTEVPFLVPPVDFSTDTIFCTDDPTNSPLLVFCSEGGLVVTQSENRVRTDITIRKEIPLTTDAFSLTADVVSQPADLDKMDQNQYGFYFTTNTGFAYALRMEGQYFSLEEWDIDQDDEITNAYNKTYAPALNSAGRKNAIQLTCGIDTCDIIANDVLIGRAPFGTGGGSRTLGFFASSDWDQDFGSVTLEKFEVTAIPTETPDEQVFYLSDPLTEDNGTFAQMGLSGAFNDFEADGFHFSPVIAYGYYAAKSGPSLANVSVKTTVNMAFDPDKSSTQYAGLVCRSNQDGMYMAVLRADATYTIFRDTVKYPFSLLAKGKIETIQAGRSDNTIQLDCIGNTITLAINGIPVESFTDSRFGIRYGRAGLYTKAGGAPYSDAIIFKDFSIKEVE